MLKHLLSLLLLCLLTFFAKGQCGSQNTNNICSHTNGDFVNAGEQITLKWNNNKTVDCVEVSVAMTGPNASNNPNDYVFHQRLTEACNTCSTPNKFSFRVPCDAVGSVTVTINWRKWSFGGGDCKSDVQTEVLTLPIRAISDFQNSYSSTFCEPGTYSVSAHDIDTNTYDIEWYDQSGSLVNTGPTITRYFNSGINEYLLKFKNKDFSCASLLDGTYLVNVLPYPDVVLRSDKLVIEDDLNDCKSVGTYHPFIYPVLNNLLADLAVLYQFVSNTGVVDIEVEAAGQTRWEPSNKVLDITDDLTGLEEPRACEFLLRQDGLSYRDYTQTTRVKTSTNIDSNFYPGIPKSSLNQYLICDINTNWIRLRRLQVGTVEPIREILENKREALYVDSSRYDSCSASEILAGLPADTILMGPKGMIYPQSMSVTWVPSVGVLDPNSMLTRLDLSQVPFDEFDSTAFTYTAYFTQTNGKEHRWCTRVVKGEVYQGVQDDQHENLESTFEVAEVNVFPNPSTGSLKFNFSNQHEYERVEVLNAQGSLVYSEPISSNKQELLLSHLDNGLYFLRFTGKSSLVKQFVLAK